MASFTSSVLRFRRLAGTTAVATLVLVAAGGLVRATDSGLGCLDEWPRCRGGWIAPLEYHALIEYAHRALAGAVAVLAVATSVAARRWTASNRGLRRWADTASVVVFVQAGLGALVVVGGLRASLVTLHFLTGMLLVAATTATWWRSRVAGTDPASGDEGRTHRLALGAAAGVVLVFVLGVLVRQEGAGLAFTDWPLMGGRLIPSFVGGGRDLQFGHRLLAVLVLGHLVGLVLAARRDRRRDVRRLSTCVLVLYLGQVAAGAANVLSLLSPVAVLAHVALGGLLWSSVVALVIETGRAQPAAPGQAEAVRMATSEAS